VSGRLVYVLSGAGAGALFVAAVMSSGQALQRWLAAAALGGLAVFMLTTIWPTISGLYFFVPWSVGIVAAHQLRARRLR
jgi:hypothetical protein